MRAISIPPHPQAKNTSALSPNRKRHIARCVIWSIAATAMVAELGYLAVGRLT